MASSRVIVGDWTRESLELTMGLASENNSLKMLNETVIHLTIFGLYRKLCKSIDDDGAGKPREMLALHTNPHAVHDCERQFWNPGAVS